MANTQALAAPATYLNALRGELVAATQSSIASTSGTSSAVKSASEAFENVAEVVRQLSERSDALLSAGGANNGTAAISRSPTTEIPAKPNRTKSLTSGQASTRTKKTLAQVAAYTAPIEIFEGTVRSVDRSSEVMFVTLTSKTRDVSDHAADISFAWVNPQDLDLVAPGAVFYLSLYRERRGGTIRNTEELRFRRMPTWTRTQIDRLKDDAARLYSKLQTRPLLDE
ncbi:hypothetical protein [Paraburkholderia sp.]|uniref:hypothetical protein n=1 Tax=Paraburkholderia sp. TaxID=1926495 RepID=UPI0039E593CD